jgi:hypothetical protein
LGRFAGFVGALVVVSIAVGCGSSGSAPLTKAEFLKRGDAICREGKEEKDNAVLAYEEKNHLDTPLKVSKAAEEGLVTDVALPPIRTMVEELGGLGVPPGDEHDVDAIVASYEKGLEEIEKNPGEALLSFPDPFAKAKKLAVDYGLKSCAEL